MTGHVTDTSGILTRVDAVALDGLTVAEGLSDPGLAAAVADGESVTVAIRGGARIVGYICAREPGIESRLFPVVEAIELRAFEVAAPVRRQGVFTAMFQAMFRRELESKIIYVVADPRERSQRSARTFRDELSAVLGALGFVPFPTDDPTLHPSPDATLFVRIGRGVATSDLEDFLKRLRSPAFASVALSLKGSVMRALLREDLERCGFSVRSVSASGTADPADILITDDGDGAPGRLLTVRLSGSLQLQWRDGTLWYPATELDRLASLLRAEVDGRKKSA